MDRILMIRWRLDDLPQTPVPQGFSIRYFRPGDEEAWLEIQTRADPLTLFVPDHHRLTFGEEPVSLAMRQCFVCARDGHAVGTCTAWSGVEWEGIPSGRIHWLAVHPDYQGQGLGAALLFESCLRLRLLSFTRAYLVTSPNRTKAIALYRRFGFSLLEPTRGY